ncbi:hypothetical protein SAMN05216302_102515 [Nitrosomonas aestuarii]|uniref:Uncharacterized protein n=1 Tax=Nitrosomonas aestuarii TaxID=52441 RepID=A0A1I4E1D3_9PROT|nr:hypothetical protein SAMN05216302_102515 [Nitrosomonas aestuarii]
MKNHTLMIVLTVLMITGCSTRRIYDAFQYEQRNECLKLPGSQYDECMERVSKPFDRYDKERNEALVK